VWRYFSVVEIVPCPSRSFTTTRSAPPANSQDACACRSPCGVTRKPRFAMASALRQGPERNQSPGMCPTVSTLRPARGASLPAARRAARYAATALRQAGALHEGDADQAARGSGEVVAVGR
jgi:hypothetical protein